MENYDTLIEALEQSVKKNGEKPLTNKWLLNILKKVDNKLDSDANKPDLHGFDPHWD